MFLITFFLGVPGVCKNSGPETAEFYYSSQNRAVVTDGIDLARQGIYQISFPDNLRIYSLEKHDEPLAVARIFIRHQVDLSSLERGYATIFERVVHNFLLNKKGSAAIFLQASGATFRSHVTREYSSYEIRVSANLFEKALDHLKKWVFDIKIDEKEFKQARKNLLAESITAWNDPGLRALNTIDSIFNSPFMSSCGIKGNPGLLKDSDLRGLKHFHKNNFKTSNSVIILAGDFKAEKAAFLAGDIFSFHDFQKNENPIVTRSAQPNTIEYSHLAPELVTLNVDSKESTVTACWPGVKYSDPRSSVIDFLAFLSQKLPHVKGHSITPVFNRGFLAFEYKKDFQILDYIHINEVLDYLKAVPEKLKELVLSDKFNEYKEEFLTLRSKIELKQPSLDKVIFHAGVSGMINRFSALSSLLQDNLWERDLENDRPVDIANLCDTLFEQSKASFIIAGPIKEIEKAFESEAFKAETDELSNDPDSRIMNILFPDLTWNAHSVVKLNALTNSLRVIRQEDSLASEMSFFIIIDSGRGKEALPHAGISDITAALMADSFSEEFKVQAVSGQDFICLKFMVPESRADQATEIVKRALSFKFPGTEALKKVKKAMGLYSKKFEKSIFYEAVTKLNSFLFSGVAGIPDFRSGTLARIDEKAVKDYIESVIRPANLAVSVKYHPRMEASVETIFNSLSTVKNRYNGKPYGFNRALVQRNSFPKLVDKSIEHDAPIGNYENYFIVFKSPEKFVLATLKNRKKASLVVNPEYASFRLTAEILKDEFIRNLGAEELLYDSEIKPWFTEVNGIYTIGICLKKGYLKRADKVFETLLQIGESKGFSQEKMAFALSRINATESPTGSNLYYQAQGFYSLAFKQIENYHTTLFHLLDKTDTLAVKKAAAQIGKTCFKMNVLLDKSKP